jgi:hypothetical protein
MQALRFQALGPDQVRLCTELSTEIVHDFRRCCKHAQPLNLLAPGFERKMRER